MSQVSTLPASLPESSGAWTQSPQLLALCACQAHSPLGPHDDKCHAVLEWILTQKRTPVKQPGKLDKVCRSVKVKGTVSGEVLGVTILLGFAFAEAKGRAHRNSLS